MFVLTVNLIDNKVDFKLSSDKNYLFGCDIENVCSYNRKSREVRYTLFGYKFEVLLLSKMQSSIWYLWSIVALAAIVNNIASASETLTCTITRRDNNFHEDRHYMLCQIKDQSIDAPNITIASTGDDHLVNDFSIFNQTDMFFLPDKIGERFPNLIAMGSGFFKIRSLQRSNFFGFRRLRNLYVTNSDLEKIEHDTFQSLDTLVILDLSNNKITSINPTWFENKKLLVWLDLTSNKIETIPQRCFDDLPSLESVFLSANKIRRIASPLFLNNNVISELQLVLNPLVFISDTAFDGSFTQLRVELWYTTCFENRFAFLTIPPDDWRSIVREICNGSNVLGLE